jgi:WhiB family transcriptional regulator, redox-sensing transcriptional regulator
VTGQAPRGEVWIPDIDPPGDWVGRATCRGVDPDLFFPDRGGDVDRAKAICADCPVRDDCLDYALRWRIRFGIWGGLSERSRRRLVGEHRSRPRRPTPGHGTGGRYRYGCRCDECREAHRAETAGYRETSRRRAASVSGAAL